MPARRRPKDEARSRAVALGSSVASGPRLVDLGLVVGRVRRWVSACLAEEMEQRRLFPWIAVAYGVGIALAFAARWPLSALPPLVLGAALTIASAVVRARPARLAACVALAAVAFGFAAAVLRTNDVAGAGASPDERRARRRLRRKRRGTPQRRQAGLTPARLRQGARRGSSGPHPRQRPRASTGSRRATT